MVKIDAKVVNVHWFSTVSNLPQNTIYVGRPSLYGNDYSTKSGKYSKEECVALHRIDLYKSLTQDPSLVITIRRDLGGHDLACWCVQPKKAVACHAYNFLHILSDNTFPRDYSKSVTFYLMDDLRTVLSNLSDWVRQSVSADDYLFTYIHLNDVRLTIERALLYLKDKKLNQESLYFLLALLVVELEIAQRDTNPETIAYRFDHVIWNVYRFTADCPELYHEPTHPLFKKESTHE